VREMPQIDRGGLTLLIYRKLNAMGEPQAGPSEYFFAHVDVAFVWSLRQRRVS
jgi:hypothetical protein